MRSTAVLFTLSLALMACGDDDEDQTVASSTTTTEQDEQPDETEPTEPAQTILAEDTPADLLNLWESNMEPDTELRVIETDAGPVFVHEENRFAFGSCDATEASGLGDQLYSVVCNP